MNIPDHVGREAVRLLNEACGSPIAYKWPKDRNHYAIHALAKMLMNPPAPMTDPDEEAAKRVLAVLQSQPILTRTDELFLLTEQMRKEREAWEKGR